MTLLTVTELHITKQQKTLLHIPHCTFTTAQHTAIIGPNGAGKSTLLTALAGGNRQSDPAIFYQHQPLSQFNTQTLAQKRAVLNQHHNIAFPISVENLIALGREPYRYTDNAKHNTSVINHLITQFQLEPYRHRNAQTLSGGEQHRAQIARVLAQLLPNLDSTLEGKWLLLDEPTNHLDLRHQHQLMHSLKTLTAKGLTIISVLHDPALALNHAHQICLLKNGNYYNSYPPQQLANNVQPLNQIYDLSLEIHIHQGAYSLYPTCTITE
ncbi:ATP-binding cassette domain-containing protein [Suttonella ornithocola]|uniref:Hemin import ATP-binding protein HmuV n=1 Tax=Suttonella ornithocola TaxID=279832 RepID=A0A380MNB6_9GAMM|nr:ATP-binding cassette domain-containing protein [Suttonella ornithocola]SUO93231.1 Hemin import ATP-binding protein HmuV [Suttonella ornithocola]